MLELYVEEFIGNLKELNQFITDNILGTDAVLSETISADSQTSKNDSSSLQKFMFAHRSMSEYRRKFNYSAIIILIYGYFEVFLERVIKQYIKTIASSVKGFEQLPEKIKQNHFSKSIDLSQKLK